MFNPWLIFAGIVGLAALLAKEEKKPNEHENSEHDIGRNRRSNVGELRAANRANDRPGGVDARVVTRKVGGDSGTVTHHDSGCEPEPVQDNASQPPVTPKRKRKGKSKNGEEKAPGQEAPAPGENRPPEGSVSEKETVE